MRVRVYYTTIQNPNTKFYALTISGKHCSNHQNLKKITFGWNILEEGITAVTFHELICVYSRLMILKQKF